MSIATQVNGHDAWESWDARKVVELPYRSPEEQSELDQAVYEAHVEAEQFDQWRGERILTVADMRNLPKPEPLLGENILFTGTNAWILGAPGCYKSFIALAWSCCIATGTSWLGHGASLQKVLYISLEATSGLMERMDAWIESNPSASPRTLEKNLTFIKELNLSQDFDRAMFLEAVQVGRYGLVVIDTQARAVVGANENDKHEMDPFISLLTKAAQTSGATTLTVHHSPKGDANPFRGSGSIEGAADSAFWIKKTDDLRFDLNFYRQKDTPSGHTWQYELLEVGNSLSITNSAPDADNSPRRTLEDEVKRGMQLEALRMIRESGNIGMTRSDITRDLKSVAERLNAPQGRSTLYRVVDDIMTGGLAAVQGDIEPTKQGARWVITTAGKLRIASSQRHSEGYEDPDYGE